jgi:hypothetical protein
MSVDLFPALDAGRTDVKVALERDPSVGNVDPIGAASLFYRNDLRGWPEEDGNDLVSRYRGITHLNLASTGATIGDVFGEQIAAMGESDAFALITLTIGGEDLFSAFSAKPGKKLLAHILGDIVEAYDLLVHAIRGARPNAVLILNTVVDPSDRTGRIAGILEDVGSLPLQALDLFNQRVRELASQTADTILSETYGAFLGRGASVDENDRWYWRRSPLEPNARGAHELRKLWLETLNRAEYGDDA